MTDFSDPRLQAWLKIIDARKREAIQDAAIRQLDGAQSLAEMVINARGLDLERIVDEWFRRLQFTSIGTVDLANPGNSALTAALRQDIDAEAERLALEMTMGLSETARDYIRIAGKMWVDASAGKAVMAQSLAESVKRVKRLTESQADELFNRLQAAALTGGNKDDIVAAVADITGRTKGQAGQVVHDSLFSGARQADLANGNAAEAEYYHMMGPVDDRITQICYEHVGMILSREDWLAVDPLVFLYGLHHRCRHKWVAITGIRLDQLRAKGWTEGERLIRNTAAQKTIIQISEQHGGNVQAWFDSRKSA